jgi:hypothetical protein
MKRLLLALALCLGLTPAQAQQSVFVPATQASVRVGAVTTILEIIPAIAGKSIYVTQITLRPIATSVVTLSYGTGTNCGTGTAVFYGPATAAAAENIIAGTGNGAIFVVPQSNAVCITVTTAVAPGWISYGQF